MILTAWLSSRRLRTDAKNERPALQENAVHRRLAWYSDVQGGTASYNVVQRGGEKKNALYFISFYRAQGPTFSPGTHLNIRVISHRRAAAGRAQAS